MGIGPRIPEQLTREQFLEVIRNAPLVSIDLVAKDRGNRILLGCRVNEPASGQWFVPGGRIRKDESLEDAFRRICESEIKEGHALSEARFVGTFTHKYDTNVFLTPGVSTHYVVLAFELRLPDDFETPEGTEQHTRFRWFSREEVDPETGNAAFLDVHPNVLPYFRDPSDMTDTQYEVLNARRDVHNNLVWQTPVLSLTAQAFLFSIVLSGEASAPARMIASLLAMIASLGSLQLMAKHRFMEEEYGRLLHAHESANRRYAANRRLRAKEWTRRPSSYAIWSAVLWTFFGAAALSIFMSALVHRFQNGFTLADLL